MGNPAAGKKMQQQRQQKRSQIKRLVGLETRPCEADQQHQNHEPHKNGDAHAQRTAIIRINLAAAVCHLLLFFLQSVFEPCQKISFHL